MSKVFDPEPRCGHCGGTKDNPRMQSDDSYSTFPCPFPFHWKKDKEPKESVLTTQEQIAEEFDRLKELVLHKNRQYGDSAIDPIRVFSKADKQEQLRVRIDDKLSRLMRGDDSIEDEDVINDLIGYLVLLKVAQNGDT